MQDEFYEDKPLDNAQINLQDEFYADKPLDNAQINLQDEFYEDTLQSWISFGLNKSLKNIHFMYKLSKPLAGSQARGKDVSLFHLCFCAPAPA